MDDVHGLWLSAVVEKSGKPATVGSSLQVDGALLLVIAVASAAAS